MIIRIYCVAACCRNSSRQKHAYENEEILNVRSHR